MSWYFNVQGSMPVIDGTGMHDVYSLTELVIKILLPCADAPTAGSCAVSTETGGAGGTPTTSTGSTSTAPRFY